MKVNMCKILFAVCALLIVCSSCTPSYDEQWIVGKTDEEIISRYGKFDTRYNLYDSEGTYEGWIGTFTLKEERVGFLQTYPEECLKVTFDTNNVAVNCKVDVGRPGN